MFALANASILTLCILVFLWFSCMFKSHPNNHALVFSHMFYTGATRAVIYTYTTFHIFHVLISLDHFLKWETDLVLFSFYINIMNSYYQISVSKVNKIIILQHVVHS